MSVCEWIYCVPTAAEGQAYAPHMADRGAGGGAPGRQPGSPRSHLGPETGERMLGEDQQILGSGSWPPFRPHPGKVMRILVSGEGTDLENMSPPRCGSCPLTREPICPTEPEITRRPAEECPLSRAHLDRRYSPWAPVIQVTTASSVTGRWGLRVVTVVQQPGGLFSKHFCQWPWRTLCVRHPQEILKFRQLSNSKLNTPRRSLVLWICVRERPECDCAGSF